MPSRFAIKNDSVDFSCLYVLRPSGKQKLLLCDRTGVTKLIVIFVVYLKVCRVAIQLLHRSQERFLTRPLRENRRNCRANQTEKKEHGERCYNAQQHVTLMNRTRHEVPWAIPEQVDCGASQCGANEDQQRIDRMELMYFFNFALVDIAEKCVDWILCNMQS